MVFLESPYPVLPPPPSQNIHAFIFENPAFAPQKDYTVQIEALTGKRRTRSEFINRVHVSATALGAGVENGGLGLLGEREVVGILGDNSMEYVSLVHALFRIAIPIALLSSHSTSYELSNLYKTTGCTRVFASPHLLSTALEAARQAGTLSEDKVYVFDGQIEGRLSLDDLTERIKEKKASVEPMRNAERDTLAYMVSSSGTTGLPKAVMVSHGNIIFSLMQALTVLRVNTGFAPPPPPKTSEGLSINAAFLPFYHAIGLHSECLRRFLFPSTSIIFPRWNLEHFLDAVVKYGVTGVVLIPSAIHTLVHSGVLQRRAKDLHSITLAVSGGANLPPSLASKFLEYVPNTQAIGNGYGLSECTIAAAGGPPVGLFYHEAVVPSTGVLLPGMKARIVRSVPSATSNEGAVDADYDEVGELWLYGANIVLGYRGNEKATRETFVEGWLRTGDRFSVRRNGFLRFHDRAKDTLKISGLQVSPAEVEAALLAHPDRLVTDVSVAGVTAAGGGRTSDELVPRAWVVLSEEGARLDEETVRESLFAWAKKTLSKYKQPRGGIEVVKELPKSPTGKVLRRVLQDRYAQAQAKELKARL